MMRSCTEFCFASSNFLLSVSCALAVKFIGFSTSAMSPRAATKSALRLLAAIGPASAFADVADVLGSSG